MTGTTRISSLDSVPLRARQGEAGSQRLINVPSYGRSEEEALFLRARFMQGEREYQEQDNNI